MSHTQLPPINCWNFTSSGWLEIRAKGPAGDRKRKLRVLLVEDDLVIAEMYRAQLEHDGYEVQLATTGRSGFAMINAIAPDIVLLDVLLPDWNGFDLMSEMSKLDVRPPIVILSNYGDPAMVDHGVSLGAIEYLVKSRVDPGQVSRSIPAWIDRSRHGRGRD